MVQIQRRLQALFQTYSTRLAIGLFLLVVATTLSVGVPAYWLTHVQLNEQVATHLRDAQQSTISLLQIEQRRLQNVALLFAQRPTLATLLASNQAPDAARQSALDAYIANFQEQIDLDLLIICRPDGSMLAGSQHVVRCPESDGFLWVDERPALVAHHLALTPGTSVANGENVRGLVVVGVWLNQDFWTQLSAETGVQQTLVAADGARLVSSLHAADWLQTHTPQALPLAAGANTGTNSRANSGSKMLRAGGHYYYQLLAPLVNSDGQVIFYSEILLAADELVATRSRVLGILLTSTGLVAILGVTLGLWSIRHVTSPLAALTALAERISQGEFETPIPAFGGVIEVQTLSAALQRSQASVVQALADRAMARDRLDNLVQSLVQGVVILDDEGKITFWNEGAALITGWPVEQAHGKSLDQVLPPVESHQPTLLSALPPPGQQRRMTVLTSGGKSSVLDVTSVRSTAANASKNSASQRQERALVLRDVTEEEAMHHLRAYFLANISHEFRTPLSTLNASMELLMDESRDEHDRDHDNGSGHDASAAAAGTAMSGAEMRALLKPIHLSLLELQTLIDNLLEGSTIEAGEFRLRKRMMSINEAITGALTVVQPMLERRRQTISVTEPALLGQLWGDRVRLTQVLVNLLANASKYTPMGEAIDIVVEVRADGTSGASGPDANRELYRVMVADRGPGIPAAERVNLFRRFVRLESSQSGLAGDQKADVHGTGIGLYVVKTTIEAHAGRVGIDERAGGGSIFWFEIPRGEMPAS
jgi:two-component system phosphate regulon sensor histidine kinase PhoR